MLDRLWHAEQVSEMRSLASPSGNWTAARSCICSCPLAGRTKNKEPAIVQIKSDLMDIVPPSSFAYPYLRRRILPLRYKKNLTVVGDCHSTLDTGHTVLPTLWAAQIKPNCKRIQVSRGREFRSQGNAL